MRACVCVCVFLCLLVLFCFLPMPISRQFPHTHSILTSVLGNEYCETEFQSSNFIKLSQPNNFFCLKNVKCSGHFQNDIASG